MTAKNHTATHLLCALIPHPVDGCSITAGYARLDFHMTEPLDKELRQKISMFCNVPVECVIEELDVAHSIYEVPIDLQKENVDDLVCRKTNPRSAASRIIEP